jgi:hypothetical protein
MCYGRLHIFGHALSETLVRRNTGKMPVPQSAAVIFPWHRRLACAPSRHCTTGFQPWLDTPVNPELIANVQPPTALPQTEANIACLFAISIPVWIVVMAILECLAAR